MLLYVWSTLRPMYLLDLHQIVTSHPVRRTQQHFTQFQQLVIGVCEWTWMLRFDLRQKRFPLLFTNKMKKRKKS